MSVAKERSTHGWPTSTSIALIITCAVTLRLIIAYALLPADAGFAADLGAFRSWAVDLGTNGPWGYTRAATSLITFLDTSGSSGHSE